MYVYINYKFIYKKVQIYNLVDQYLSMGRQKC